MTCLFFFFRFVAKPCAIALNIQTSGPQVAQPNAILEKVFTAITKVRLSFPGAGIAMTAVLRLKSSGPFSPGPENELFLACPHPARCALRRPTGTVTRPKWVEIE